MVMTLQGLHSRHALKALLWTLRARPVICLPDGMSILSDLACSAREKPVTNLIPGAAARSSTPHGPVMNGARPSAVFSAG
jgi:hypothetical protein